MKLKYIVSAALFVAGSLTSMASMACQTADIKTSDASVLMGPPGQMNTAGYVRFENMGNEMCTLVGASSPAAEKVELHTSKTEGGRMKMEPVMELTIPAHGELLLAPGGNHLMLMNLKAPLKAGEQLPIMMKFSDGQELTVNAQVKDMREMPMAH